MKITVEVNIIDGTLYRLQFRNESSMRRREENYFPGKVK